MSVGQGKLQIIDRKKHIFKLAQGEYLAPERIETHLLANEFVEQIFIYGNSEKAYPLAVVVPNRKPVIEWAKENNIVRNFVLPFRILHKFIDTEDWEALCADPRVADKVLVEIALSGLRTFGSKLNPYEIPKGILLEPIPFSIENGKLTPTNKPRRHHLKNVYGARMEEMYRKLDNQVRLLDLVSQVLGDGNGNGNGNGSEEEDEEGKRNLVESSANFFRLGGDSLSAARLVAKVKEEFGVNVPANLLYGEEANLADVVKFLNEHESQRQLASPSSSSQFQPSASASTSSSGIDWSVETTLPATVIPLPHDDDLKNPTRKKPTSEKVFLLTGATGFLGIYLLVEILKLGKKEDRKEAVASSLKVYCIIRSKDDAKAARRLEQTIKFFELESSVDLSRVIPIAGDIALPKLGLNETTHAKLCGEVDTIFHCGAWVNGTFIKEKKNIPIIQINI
ncbi:Carboxylic acid reductase [Coelomomyces lativittatus]|nr:Carboxylic acid reductase [Coelomomyces lativittatus]